MPLHVRAKKRSQNTPPDALGARLILALIASALISQPAMADDSDNTTGKVGTSLFANPVNTSNGMPAGDTHISWLLGIGGESIQEQSTSATLATANLRLDVEHDFSKELVTKLEVGIYASAGSSAYFLSDQYKPGTSVNLNEGSIAWSPTWWGTVKGGVLKQNEMASPLLIDNQSFAGVSEQIHGWIGFAKVSLTAEQTIPTVDGLSPRNGGAQPMPYLFLEKAAMNWEVSRSSQIRASMSYFDFGNLPSAVASDGLVWGNTIQGLGATASQFNYQYAGVEASAGFTIGFSKRLKWNADSTYINNLYAPVGSNEGLLIRNGLTFTFNNGMKLTPEIAYIYNQSDSSPAEYNSVAYGHNNIEGYAIGARFDMPKSKLHLNGVWVNGTPIDPNAFQSDHSFVFLGLETDYELL